MYKKNAEMTIRSSTAEYLTYVASTGESNQNIEVRYEDENIWLTQKMCGLLFDVEPHTINYHIKKIFTDSELSEEAVTRKFRITADDGKTYNTKHYNYKISCLCPILTSICRIWKLVLKKMKAKSDGDFEKKFF